MTQRPLNTRSEMSEGATGATLKLCGSAAKACGCETPAERQQSGTTFHPPWAAQRPKCACSEKKPLSITTTASHTPDYGIPPKEAAKAGSAGVPACQAAKPPSIFILNG